jgi:cytochrome b6-f complex iron-sulfur subunit
MADEIKTPPPGSGSERPAKDLTSPDSRDAPKVATQPKIPTPPVPNVIPAAAQHDAGGGDTGAPTAVAAARETGAKPTPSLAPSQPKPATGAAVAPRPVPAKPPAAPQPDLAGKTTTPAAPSVTAAKKPARAPDDSSPLLTRRAWIALSWGAFSAASVAALAATGRFMFPNVLNEPPQQFKAGFPSEYGPGVDERWKEKFGIWLVRTPDDVVHHAAGFYAIISTCTHLGCTPNYLSAEAKFKCPCHGSGFRLTGINFEGPAPRPLERARIVLADDGQILVDKSRKFQYELGQWLDPESFLKA